MRFLDRLLQKWRAHMARKWIPPGARILEIGCHQGEFLESLGDHIGPSVGYDPLATTTNGKNYHLIRDILPIPAPFPNNNFDVIVLLATLEHIQEKRPLVLEAHRLLSPKGLIIATVPSPLVDPILGLLRTCGLADGMSLEEHHSFVAKELPQFFIPAGFSLTYHKRFQLGFNHLFVFCKNACEQEGISAKFLISPKGFRKFFIVGCPRSGTTLLQQALNRHSQVAIPPETAFFTFLGHSKKIQGEHLQRINEDLGIALPTPPARLHRPQEAKAFYEEMARLYLMRLGKTSVTHFGEKSNEHLCRLGRIRQVFPEAKVILIYRDGRDVALSLPRLPWTSRDLYVNFGLWLLCYWLQKRAHQSNILPLMCIRYEDLVQEPEKNFRKILAFLGLPYEPQVVEGKGNTEGVPHWEYRWKLCAAEKITPNRIGLWRKEMPVEQLGILERWGGWALRELGYGLATKGKGPLPWWFFPRVAWRTLLWLGRRPCYGQAKRLSMQKIPE